MRGLIGVVVCAALGVTGCGSEVPAGTPPASGLAAPPEGRGVQWSMRVTVPAGEEHTFCQFDAMPPSETNVHRFEHEYTGASHHLLVYRAVAAPGEVELGVPFDCDAGPDFGGTILGAYYGSQVPKDEVAFPEGVALAMPAEQLVMTEYHVLNTGSEDVEATVQINAWYPESGTAITGAAGTLLYYHDDIVIDPNGAATARMRCEVPEELLVSFVIPHMHAGGRSLTAWIESAEGSTTIIAPEASFETARFDPPLVVPAGATIRFTCELENPGAETVRDGFSAVDDEMCVLFAGYHRAEGPRLSLGEELCEEGVSGPTYAGTEGCWWLNDCDQDTWWGPTDPGSQAAEDARHACRESACESAVGEWREYTRCVDEHCKDFCWVDIECDTRDCPECLACIEAECAALDATCRASTCGE